MTRLGDKSLKLYIYIYIRNLNNVRTPISEEVVPNLELNSPPITWPITCEISSTLGQ